MRLLSVALENYRRHRSLRLDLDGNPVLIAGPNESGKSTLVEAMHRCLFLRAKIGGDVQKQMLSTHGGQPSVEVAFSVGGRRFVVRKVFSGASGSTVLEESGQPPLSGDEAESRLASLLGVEGAVSGGGARGLLERRWAHLWVWQGRAGSDPAPDVNEVAASISSQLRVLGGSEVLQSALDRRVHESLRAKRKTLFTEKGQPRADTRLARLQREREELAEGVSRAEAAVAQLQKIADRLLRAEETIGREEVTLELASTALEAAMQRKSQVETASSELKTCEAALAKFNGEIATIQKQVGKLSSARSLIPEVESRLAHADADADRSRAALEISAARLQDVERDLAAADSAFQTTSKTLEAVESAIALRQARENEEQITQRATQATTQRLVLAEKRGQLDALPCIDDEQLATLRRQAASVETKRATLEAAAVSVHVLSAPSGFSIGDTTLKPGDSHHFTDAFEISDGGSVRIKVVPGGGKTAAHAGREYQNALDTLADALAAVGCADLAAAESVAIRRALLKGEILVAEGILKNLGAKEIEKAVAAAAQETARWSSRVEELQTFLLENFALENDPAKLRKELSERNRLGSLRRAELNSAKETLTTAKESAAAELDKFRTRSATLQADLAAAKATAQALGDSFGDETLLAEKLSALRNTLATTETDRIRLIARLEELGAAEIDNEIRRNTAEQEASRRRLDEARTERASARAVLAEAGGDPTGELAELRERLSGLDRRLSAERLSADAVQHLLNHFDSQTARLEAAFTEPLIRRAGPYLATLFSGGARLQISHAEGAFSDLLLDRTGTNLGVCSFQQLSGGTREQVGIAFRLAVAEIIASGHDGTLPVVLDDAFANSDPNRLAGLRRMIAHAVNRGLQIIIASCNPSDYALLGGLTVHLGGE